MDGGLKVAVTLVKAVRDAKGKDMFSQAAKGKRLFAVQLALKNVGTETYQDSPSNGALVFDADDQQYNADFREVAAGPSLSSSLKLAPGRSGRGFLVFEVPAKAKVTRFQLALDSGFADQSGEWLLK
ncbi:DUF4352 domain-containing protein [Actinocorallia sp. B10E7]|uniref:DUF4352 domain-containing protein n=1 Tax=Actinocorallia sp. B10E7 TaxID=3153558 RepID=UPI00325D3EE1